MLVRALLLVLAGAAHAVPRVLQVILHSVRVHPTLLQPMPLPKIAAMCVPLAPLLLVGAMLVVAPVQRLVPYDSQQHDHDHRCQHDKRILGQPKQYAAATTAAAAAVAAIFISTAW